MTDEQRKKAAKVLVETYLGFPAPDREPCELDLKAVDAVHAVLAAGASEGQAEPVYQYTEYPNDGIWRDCSEREYARTNPKWRRIVYTRPSAEIAALRERIAGMEKKDGS